MSKYIFAVLITIAASCTNEEGARRTLDGAGYTNVRILGHRSFSCGGDDTCTEFEAFGPSGRRVTGAVGCGYSSGCSKGCTIRLD